MYKPYSDATLMRMTKAELIDQFRLAEHNYQVVKEAFEEQRKNIVEVIRCKDCALRGYAGCVNQPYDDYCPERFPYPEFGDDDFCSRGVRKENE